MNAVEIEAAVSDLAAREFDADEFPFEFLRAFGNKETTVQRLRAGASNRSDVGGVLQTNNIHMAVATVGEVSATLGALRTSSATAKGKVQFILATDGRDFEAEDLETGETVACAYTDFPNHFGFFLPLAGITTVKQIRESAFDIRATSRLNRLYLELLKDNPDWGTSERRHDMNHFMARLIFCFFAEDTDIFSGKGLFTNTVSAMSETSSSNTHEVVSEIFRAMNAKHEDRVAAGLPRWALSFPYVNGGLFSGTVDVPRFSKIARSYLIHIGGLEWTRVNPDIFGSMIQAVADDEERGALGMHYTSVPNILKVLNPLFLDDLRAKLEEAGTNARMLLNLRKRITRIRVFDPACGSGNFLVIAYKQLREIENAINERRGESGRASEIPLTNFRGIELRDFAAEIARLALIIAEFQSDVLYRGQQEALKEFLPLDSHNWITCANALRIDWLSICPPTGTGVRLVGDDLFGTPLDQAEIDFSNAGGETYLCGNPPYSGKGKKEDQHQDDMRAIFGQRTDKYGYVDYVGCWLVLASEYCAATGAAAALVATNSVCQGRQLPQLWPHVIGGEIEIAFAHRSFKWSNNASHNAGVICVVIGLQRKGAQRTKYLYDDAFGRAVRHISPYLIEGDDVYVESSARPLARSMPAMLTGSVPNDGGNLLMDVDEAHSLTANFPEAHSFLHRFAGSQDFLQGAIRYCLLIPDGDLARATTIPQIRERLKLVSELRHASKKAEVREHLADLPHRFQHRAKLAAASTIIVPSVSSERREWFPCGLLPAGTVVSNLAFFLADQPLWILALLVSRLHLVWLGTVCGKLKSDYRYSNTLGWHTYPVPPLTEKNMKDLERCAEDILITREAFFPATISELYNPESMPGDLRAAHERNDEVLERIYLGRRFRNDTERLEKLFDLYTKMTSRHAAPAKRKGKSIRA